MTGLYYPGCDGGPEKLEQAYGALTLAPADLPEAVSFVFLCFTNRCGSNYLAEILASGGDYNRAGEVLNPETVRRARERKGHASFQSYVSWLVSRHAQSDRMFMKVGVAQLELLGRTGVLAQIMPRSTFLLAERADKLAQAISHVLAFKTGRFKSTMPEAVAPEAIAFSPKLVDKALALIVRNYWEFGMFFGRNGVVPVHAIYEQLTADPAAYARFIAGAIGLPDFVYAPNKLSLERQANAVNAAWREQYLALRPACSDA